MANPSLQIGNDNWAVKEDNLLGYSTAGTRFVPEPITMTRGSASTRVNPSGLVETVELLGSEEVTCGDFSCADPNAVWTKSANWTIANNLATSDGSQTGNVSLKQSNTLNNLTTGTTYKVQFTISGYVAGVINPHLRGVQSGNVTGDGIKTSYITAGSGSDGINLYAGSTFKGSISNVSVKESTRNDLARVDYTDGSVSSLLAEPQRTNKVTYSETYGSGTFFSATSGSTIDNTTSMSPSGDTNATQVTSTGAGKIQSGTLSLTQNTDYVLSFYAKNVDATLVNSRVYATGGSGGTNLTSVDYTSQLSTTEWTRITHIFNTGTNTAIYVYLSSALNSGGTIQLWGAQLEEGSYATSYIPNFGTALGVTRVQDQYEKTGISNLINSAEGVLFAEMAALSNDSTRKAITLSDGTTSNRVMLRYQNSSNAVQCFINVGNVLYSNLNESSYTITDFLKIAFKWKAGDFALWINGAEVATSTDATSFGVGVLTELQFNEGDGAGSEYFGKVKQLQVFKTALTDSELETLTTI